MFDEKIERAENALASNPEYRRVRDSHALPIAIADLLRLAEVKGIDPGAVPNNGGDPWGALTQIQRLTYDAGVRAERLQTGGELPPLIDRVCRIAEAGEPDEAVTEDASSVEADPMAAQ
jgi:hypothetical protein